MPCQRCGARQDDPVRGASPWKRGVAAGEQVLICPDCQRADGWAADLDCCPSCGGLRLSKMLGVLRCGDCEWTGDGEVAPRSELPANPSLGSDVRAALDRLFKDRPRGAR